jgi:Protein of unknown function (DUF1573)
MKKIRRIAVFGLSVIVGGYFLPACDSNSGELEKGELSANRLIEIPASSEVNVEVGALPVMAFGESVFDFGEIESGEIVEHTYIFKNTGEGPLLISNATASCGCTVPSWPKDPIEANSEGEIKVRFDSKGKSGNQNKTVTIISNTQPNKTTLTLKGFVKSPVKEEETNS